jgi:hypothetical protein
MGQPNKDQILEHYGVVFAVPDGPNIDVVPIF